MNNPAKLPTAFADLERFVADWSIRDEPGRNLKRIHSTMDQLREFYDAVLPQMEPIVEHLRPKPLGAMDAQDERLFYLAMMLMEAAPALEIYHDPDVPNSFEPERFKILPPYAQTAVAAR